MPLEILGPLVGVGIGLTVFLVWLLVNAPPRLLASREDAQRALARDDAEARLGDCLFAEDGRAALCRIDEPPGRIALLSVMGSRHVTRCASAGDIRQVEINGNGLTVRLADFTFPQFSIRLADDEQARQGQAWLEALRDGKANLETGHAGNDATGHVEMETTTR